MGGNKLHLKGSPSRDEFKYWHKRAGPPRAYATDLDFVLIEKFPYRIAAVIDYKTLGDKISFAEVVAYNEFLKAGWPVYIIQGPAEPPFNNLSVYEYEGGDPVPNPPIYNLRTVAENMSETEYWTWEMWLRESAHD